MGAADRLPSTVTVNWTVSCKLMSVRSTLAVMPTALAAAAYKSTANPHPTFNNGGMRKFARVMTLPVLSAWTAAHGLAVGGAVFGARFAHAI